MSVKQERYSRDWGFTLNNPKPNQMKEIEQSSLIRYIIYQLELSTTGTKHMQGYVEFHEPISFSETIELFKDGWIDQRRGSRIQARNYCTKPETRVRGPWVYGVWIEEEEKQPQCTGVTTKGIRCKNFSMLGKDTCSIHRNQID